ncbi:MAG: hypothetical protein LBR22_08490 [Desulfovibrio sp.]|jgi:DNA-directed RNA polymerase subunit RPC12/RpoP|nr:hypothetical protein [Desulfovibrio sp.]
MRKKTHIEPVPPDGMEILFFYQCPHCNRHVPVVNPIEPNMIVCEHCAKRFPIIPVDDSVLNYIRIMLAGGKAASSPDFI